MRAPRKIPAPCKIPTCARKVRAGKALMCPEHWAKVPRANVTRIYATLRDFHGTGNARAYLNAVRDAIDAVQRLETPDPEKARQGSLNL